MITPIQGLSPLLLWIESCDVESSLSLYRNTPNPRSSCGVLRYTDQLPPVSVCGVTKPLSVIDKIAEVFASNF